MANKVHYSKEPYAVTLYGGGSGGGGGSMRFISGTGAPTENDGAPGDIYLDTSNGDLYNNKNGAWTLELNLVGPKGTDGADGAQGPQGTPGTDGATGPAGPAGTDGTNGSDGADGFGTEAQYDAIISRLDALEATE